MLSLIHIYVKSISYIDDRVEVIEDQCVLCGHCINAVSYTHLDVYKRQTRRRLFKAAAFW